ncbi:alpha/beta hydrolase [Halieaceae bacterium IMCC14734]|uniref:Proline iminopeptidase n=1 Tax=Candidatus Litorirhabdus singularis TaxID=2518993 RepID=A0ABT3TEK5_9GAMM|nr:alpha/beta hydrolase [Candidatus Litorirhabdus singularis]MCX2980679.1 alpha/beta hydrolase [Candidatus Litorirhabdus singularis]
MKVLARWFVYPLLGFIVLVLTVALSYRSYKQSSIENETQIVSPRGIQTLELVELNGLQQWVKIRGHDTSNPVLLYLHGGPGMPELPFSHLFDLEIEEHFTVVHWDQRGSGKTRRQGFSNKDLTVPVFIDDTLALTNHLRARFQQDKIYLAGHSWGSMLGTLVVQREPELFHAYIGLGQLTNLHDNEVVSLNFVREEAVADNNKAAIAELAALAPPYTDDIGQLRVQRKWLYYYGGGFRGLGYADIFLAVFTSPDYSLADTYAMLKGLDVSAVMWPEVARYNLEETALDWQVPVYFLAGRYDYNTPSELAERYFEKLSAPRKAFIWFEKSAHMMNLSDPQFYQDTMINRVLAETQ